MLTILLTVLVVMAAVAVTGWLLLQANDPNGPDTAMRLRLEHDQELRRQQQRSASTQVRLASADAIPDFGGEGDVHTFTSATMKTIDGFYGEPSIGREQSLGEILAAMETHVMAGHPFEPPDRHVIGRIGAG